jgi:hypothetical protein
VKAMPISHERRFIFVHVPKAAGSSVMAVLEANCAALDFNQRNVWPRFFGDPRGIDHFHELRGFFALNSMRHFPEQHLPARILRQLVPEATWSSYFKFAFVRNPWDLVVSSYSFLKEMFHQHPATADGDPDISFIVSSVDFANYVRARTYFASEKGVLPFLCDREGRLLVDFVGRVERIEEDFKTICERIGIEAELPRLNAFPRPHYREFYTPETRDLVAREFARDIEMFGYEF